jgi:hypothetical protein
LYLPSGYATVPGSVIDDVVSQALNARRAIGTAIVKRTA